MSQGPGGEFVTCCSLGSCRCRRARVQVILEIGWKALYLWWRRTSPGPGSFNSGGIKVIVFKPFQRTCKVKIDNRSVRTVKVLTIKMKGFQARPSLQSTTASRGTPKQGPSSSPPPTLSSSPRGSTPRSSHPTPLSLNSPFLQGPSLNDSSLNSPFLQGPSLNEIENCLTGLSAEEMEQVGD